ncbi:MAG: DeoR/GlpR family DNA-binding transcription regulator [Defluviitaleaceae bacterium]|nr:DeoR/GlpR family DNA-binding transcription regulator [Defluviitaleaceae bacterium]
MTEKRHQLIMTKIEREGVVKISELVVALETSESTIRRDLVALEKLNYLRRVHGGAVSIKSKIFEKNDLDKTVKNHDQKDAIAKAAALLIDDGDRIYLDSGTTVFEMIKYMTQSDITVVTNGISHVEMLIKKEIPCVLLGGQIKPETKALVGIETLNMLRHYRFDKCFVGTNGVDQAYHFTTLDPEEAAIKKLAIDLSKEAFVLADASKFGEVSFMKFANIGDACILTDWLEGTEEDKEKMMIRTVNA